MFHFSSAQWGFSLIEEQLTKGITYFLQQSPHACWCFLAALFGCSLVVLEGLFDRQYFLKTITAEAEVYTDRKKRVDVVLSWRSEAGDRHCAVLECKLGHHISPGQLESYARFAKQKSDGGHHYLFVVAQRRDSKSDKELSRPCNQKWHYLEWKEVLRRWEQYLDHGDVSGIDGFPRFRRTVWERTIGC